MEKEVCTEPCERVEGHHLTLYGPEGRTGLQGCVRKKVSWLHLGSLVMAICLIFGAYNLYAIEKRDQRQEKVEACAANNKERIRVVEENIKFIQSDQVEIKQSIGKIEKDMVKKSDLDEKFNKIIEAIEKN